MQDFQPIPGLAGRIFTGSEAAAAARRLRNYPSSSIHNQQSPQAPIKCPRCESTNTKFCYYNNYNLSQPRHFCKSCRRYWTKGGVLRNVPVGGGCRKNSSKRSSSSSSKSSKPDKNRSKPATAPSGSSSESSSTLTAPPNPIPDPEPDPSPNPILDPPLFAETVGSSFTGLMAGGPPEGFSFADPGPLPGPLSGYRISDPEPAPQQQQQQQEAGPYVVDPTDPIQKAAAGGLNGLDWGAGGAVDSGSLFDITSSVDPAAYWNQNHWGDADPSLYLP